MIGIITFENKEMCGGWYHRRMNQHTRTFFDNEKIFCYNIINKNGGTKQVKEITTIFKYDSGIDDIYIDTQTDDK